MVFEQNKNC